MSKRLKNYRSGDRAEDLGIFLLKAFCAVAPIPRQEDFGLADAVATLLRPEGRFWYAEDSFLVQFKSRTINGVTLNGPVFKRWLAQDLSVFVGRVNLKAGKIEFFTLGTSLFDRRHHEAHGLVVSLIEGEEGLHKGVLHLKFEKPILKWSVADTEDSRFVDRTYAILAHWLQLERWNRRYFRAGVAREIAWEANAMPHAGGVVHTWTPAHGQEALADIEPLVHLLSLHARHHPELWARMYAVEDALRNPHGPGAMLEMSRFTDVSSRLVEIIKKHPLAEVAVVIQILHCNAKGANFWMHCQVQAGGFASKRHEGTWEELKQEGFDYKIDGDDSNATIVLRFDRYFANTPIPHEVIESPNDMPIVGLGEYSQCFFLRRIAADESGSNA